MGRDRQLGAAGWCVRVCCHDTPRGDPVPTGKTLQESALRLKTAGLGSGKGFSVVNVKLTTNLGQFSFPTDILLSLFLLDFLMFFISRNWAHQKKIDILLSLFWLDFFYNVFLFLEIGPSEKKIDILRSLFFFFFFFFFFLQCSHVVPQEKFDREYKQIKIYNHFFITGTMTCAYICLNAFIFGGLGTIDFFSCLVHSNDILVAQKLE